jgi:hypothetical protein
MNRPTLRVTAAALVTGLVGLAVSCSAATEPTGVPAVTHPAPSATEAATSSAAATAPDIDFNDPHEASVDAWTDEYAVQALAQDSSWDPGGCLKSMEAVAGQMLDGMQFAEENAPPPQPGYVVLPAAACKGLLPLACARLPGQSCAPDECSQSDYACYPACGRDCNGCAGKCVTSCDSCKSACKDDACRLTCAKSCGECRQSCLQALDQCTTAHCAEVGEACFKDRDDAWNKSDCPKVCPKVQKCVEKCPEVENDYSGSLRYQSECATKCLAKLGKGCPSNFKSICAGDPNASVNFNAYHEGRKAKTP